MYFDIQQLCTLDIKIECDRFHNWSLSRLFTESESDDSQLPIHTINWISLKKCTLIFFFHLDLSRREDRDLLASVDKSKLNLNLFSNFRLETYGKLPVYGFHCCLCCQAADEIIIIPRLRTMRSRRLFVVVGGKLWRIFLSSWLQPHAKRRVLDFSSAQDRWGILIGLNSEALKSSLSRTIVLKLDWPNNRIHELCIDTLR